MRLRSRRWRRDGCCDLWRLTGDRRLNRGGHRVAVAVDVLDLLRRLRGGSLRLGLIDGLLLIALAACGESECGEQSCRDK